MSFADRLLIRIFDIILASIGLILLSPLVCTLIIIGYFDSGSPFFCQKRVGIDMKLFLLFKFRSMPISTPSIPTHFIQSNNLTAWGRFIRRTKLDELPQLINVLIGDMSLVGPRPNLPSQTDLINERFLRGVYKFRPGITGLSQILKIDMSTPEFLANTDLEMIKNLSLFNYFKYIILTIIGRGSGDRINLKK